MAAGTWTMSAIRPARSGASVVSADKWLGAGGCVETVGEQGFLSSEPRFEPRLCKQEVAGSIPGGSIRGTAGSSGFSLLRRARRSCEWASISAHSPCPKAPKEVSGASASARAKADRGHGLINASPSLVVLSRRPALTDPGPLLLRVSGSPLARSVRSIGSIGSALLPETTKRRCVRFPPKLRGPSSRSAPICDTPVVHLGDRELNITCSRAGPRKEARP